MPNRVKLIAGAVIIIVCAMSISALSMPANSDGTQPSKDINWPQGFQPQQASLSAHNEIDIHASCSKVFANLVDAETWPKWYPNSHNVKILSEGDGKLHEGSRFSWETFGSQTESEVHEFVPDERLGWFGNGMGSRAYHTFLLQKIGEGCHVITEEVVKGPIAVVARVIFPNTMHNGHEQWLKTLKSRSEQQEKVP
jgi:hypothetical protein